MSMQGLAIDTDVEASDKDILAGGGFTKNTGVYDMIVDTAYMGKSQKGAVSLNLIFKAAKAAHSKDAILNAHGESHTDTSGKYLGEFVYGAIDGTITTFAVVSGAAGASLSPVIVIVLGFANLLADGFSMAAGNF